MGSGDETTGNQTRKFTMDTRRSFPPPHHRTIIREPGYEASPVVSGIRVPLYLDKYLNLIIILSLILSIVNLHMKSIFCILNDTLAMRVYGVRI